MSMTSASTRRWLLTFSVAALGWFFATQPASALTLVPPSLEFGAQPGQTLKTAIKLYNETNTPVTLYTSFANFTAQDEAGTPNFDFKNTSEGLASWITTDPAQLTLQPGDRVSVTVNIAVPANADPGGHYAAVFFGTQPPTTQGSGVSIASKVGSLIILRVAGKTVEQGTVKQFSIIGGQTLFTHPPVSFDLRIQKLRQRALPPGRNGDHQEYVWWPDGLLAD